MREVAFDRRYSEPICRGQEAHSARMLRTLAARVEPAIEQEGLELQAGTSKEKFVAVLILRVGERMIFWLRAMKIQRLQHFAANPRWAASTLKGRHQLRHR